MNHTQITTKISVYTHWVMGGDAEYWNISGNWVDICSSDSWVFDRDCPNAVRIKPEPQKPMERWLRIYSNNEETVWKNRPSAWGNEAERLLGRYRVVHFIEVMEKEED